MLITRTSPRTGQVTTLDLPVTEAQFTLWRSGTLIQKAFWNLSPAEREFIKTGYTPDDWKAIFPDGPNEGDHL